MDNIVKISKNYYGTSIALVTGGLVTAGVVGGIAYLVLGRLATRYGLNSSLLVKYGICGMTGLAAGSPFVMSAFKTRKELKNNVVEETKSRNIDCAKDYQHLLGQSVSENIVLIKPDDILDFEKLPVGSLVVFAQSDGSNIYAQIGNQHEVHKDRRWILVKIDDQWKQLIPLPNRIFLLKDH